jgi:hypothetical protein
MQTGLAVSAASLAFPDAIRAAAGQPDPADPPVELFIYDDRFDEAVQAARAATARNVPIASTTAVFSGLWYDKLDLGWQQTPMMLAGMTTDYGLFVLETLALDRNMRVIARVARESNDLVSWVIGPRKIPNSARRLF